MLNTFDRLEARIANGQSVLRRAFAWVYERRSTFIVLAAVATIGLLIGSVLASLAGHPWLAVGGVLLIGLVGGAVIGGALARIAIRRWHYLLRRLDDIEAAIGYGGSGPVRMSRAAERVARLQRGALSAQGDSPVLGALGQGASDGRGVEIASSTIGAALREALERLPRPAVAAPDYVRVVPDLAGSESTPAVTVVVPLFNEERFIRDTIVSLKSQTLENFEAIIVDDASTDRSAAFALREIGDDKRFVFTRHQKNSGLSASRNTGLRLASAPYVTFLDGDDFLLSDSLELRLNRFADITDERVAGVYCGMATAPEHVDARFVPEVLIHQGRLHSYISANGECPFNAHAPILRTSVLRKLGGFNERLLQGCEDWDLWQRVLRHGYWFEPIPQVAAVYRRKRASMVRTMPLGHVQSGRRIFDWAHNPLDVSEIVPGTPFVYRDSVETYRRQETFARRTAQYAAIAYLQDPAAFKTLLADIPGPVWFQLERLIGADAQIESGINRYFAASGTTMQEVRTEIDEVKAAIIDHIRAAALTASEGVTADRRQRPQVALFAANRKQAILFADIAVAAKASGIAAILVSTETVSGDCGVESLWRERGVEYETYNRFILRRDVLAAPVSVVMRPYDGVVRDLATGSGAELLEVADPGAPVNLPDENPPATPSKVLAPGEVLAAMRSALAESGVPAAGAAESAVAPSGPIGSLAPTIIDREERLDLYPDYERLAAFKDRYKGERCFIIGNGPSLNTLDLTKLKNDRVFAVNGIFYKKDEIGFDPTFYVVEDSSVMKENVEAIRAYQAEHKFFPTLYRNLHPADDNVHFFLMNRGFYERTGPAFCVPKFSLDAARRVYCGQSVTHINLQLAYYFGFKTVYLIGMDFSYVIPKSAIVKGDLILSTEDDPNHFNSAYFGKGKTWKDPKLHRVLLNYEISRDVYTADGREIVNATNGGKLEVFRRVAYDSLF